MELKKPCSTGITTLKGLHDTCVAVYGVILDEMGKREIGYLSVSWGPGGAMMCVWRGENELQRIIKVFVPDPRALLLAQFLGNLDRLDILAKIYQQEKLAKEDAYTA